MEQSTAEDRGRRNNWRVCEYTQQPPFVHRRRLAGIGVLQPLPPPGSFFQRRIDSFFLGGIRVDGRGGLTVKHAPLSHHTEGILSLIRQLFGDYTQRDEIELQ